MAQKPVASILDFVGVVLAICPNPWQFHDQPYYVKMYLFDNAQLPHVMVIYDPSQVLVNELMKHIREGFQSGVTSERCEWCKSRNPNDNLES